MQTRVLLTGLAEQIAQMRGGRQAIRKAWRKSLYSEGGSAVRSIKRNERGAGDTTESQTAVRTGRLRNAYGHQVLDAGDGLALDVGVIKAGEDADVLKYAAIHEFGGTIVAKNAKYLTIPLPAALTERGVLRAPAREWPNTFLIPEAMVIAQRQEDGSILPLFKLKREVTIPARPSLMPALERIEATLGDRLQEDAIAVLEGRA